MDKEAQEQADMMKRNAEFLAAFQSGTVKSKTVFEGTNIRLSIPDPETSDLNSQLSVSLFWST